ncbi:MAG: ATP-binding cassette domain-containing protein [Anaerolineae bacterium]|nr:ATP-binding cassette domain-containing protein [Anaerolineae bacterium]
MTNQVQLPLLEVRGLKKWFPMSKGFFQQRTVFVKAVDGVDIDVQAGETLGIVGESGSGKTTLGRCISRLYEPTGGQITMRTDGETLDVSALKGRELSAFRKRAQMIFQDPYSSLNPRMTVLETVGEPLLVNNLAKGKDLEERVTQMIVQVGLRMEHLRRYPHSFSGGQRQRIGIARAMVVNPCLVVADEPVSALDVSIQAQILNLLKDLQEEYALTYLFISHAMNVVRYVSDRIAVMYAGKLVELGSKQELLSHPRHPYTEALLASVPKPSQRKRGMRLVSAGEPPDLINLPKGCVFASRCKYATDQCKEQPPELRQVGTTEYVSCHLTESLTLQGI